MNELVVQLSSTDHTAVIADVQKLYPNWSGDDVRIHIPSRVDIRKIPDRILEDAEYDEDGNITKQAVLAGEYRVDIVPSVAVELPDFETRVFPENADMRYV